MSRWKKLRAKEREFWSTQTEIKHAPPWQTRRKKKNLPAIPAFYDSPEWKEVRYRALKKANGRCQCCGAGPREGAVLNVDHIKPRHRFPELALELSNLQVLCASCNQGKGSWDYTDWRLGKRTIADRLDIRMLVDLRERGLLN